MAITKQSLEQLMRAHLKKVATSTPQLIGLNAAYTVRVTEPFKAVWTIDYRDMKLGDLTEGADPGAIAGVVMSASTLEQLFSKGNFRSEGKQLTLEKKITFEGDSRRATDLRRLFGGNRWSRKYRR